jgi:hypothetical protein
MYNYRQCQFAVPDNFKKHQRILLQRRLKIIATNKRTIGNKAGTFELEFQTNPTRFRASLNYSIFIFQFFNPVSDVWSVVGAPDGGLFE